MRGRTPSAGLGGGTLLLLAVKAMHGWQDHHLSLASLARISLLDAVGGVIAFAVLIAVIAGGVAALNHRFPSPRKGPEA